MLNTVEEWLRVVVDTAVDGVVLIDAHGVVLVFNPACERLFGYQSTEIVGQNVKKLMPKPFHLEHDSYLSNYHRTGDKKIIGIGREVRGRRKDGTTFPVKLSVGEAKRNGEPLYVGIIHDITEAKRAEEQHQFFMEELIASNEDRGHFAYVASHDMQEHLRMVLAFNTILMEGYGDTLDAQAKEYLSMSLRAASQMRDLVNDLLEFGRLNSDAERAREFDANAESCAVLEIIADAVRNSKAQIVVDPLPVLHGNPIRFRRLLQNLICNSLKYVDAKTIPVINVSVEDMGGEWEFCVRDNGIGIAPDYFFKVFEPFKRLHTKSEHSGSGLGLAICKKIVSGFGGRIWVESVPDGGSAFYFTIAKKVHPQ